MSNELTVTEKDKLAKGAQSAIDFVGNFQHLALVGDESGSMSERLPGTDSRSKSALQRDVVAKYIRDKVAKSDMLVTIIGFSTGARVLANSEKDTTKLLSAAQQLSDNGGSTHLANGLVHAMNAVRKSLDYIPHIVVTSDGQVHDGFQCEEIAKQAKAEGVVIDTIFIGDANDRSGGAEWLKKLAEMTGGVFEGIANAAEFEKKYLKVMARPLLTAGN